LYIFANFLTETSGKCFSKHQISLKLKMPKVVTTAQDQFRDGTQLLPLNHILAQPGWDNPPFWKTQAIVFEDNYQPFAKLPKSLPAAAAAFRGHSNPHASRLTSKRSTVLR
jgi:hypothetical protein